MQRGIERDKVLCFDGYDERAGLNQAGDPAQLALEK